MLLTLAVLLQTRSVSRTARRLGTSQPTVSRALAQLRGLLADPLLVRAGGGMALTQRGAELATPLQEWMSITSSVLQPRDFQPATLDRSFHVAATDYGVLSVISPVLPAVNAAAPGCRMELSGYCEDMFRKLASGDLDLIIYGFKPDETVTHARHLFSESQSIIVRPDHPLMATGQRPILLADYLAWPHVAVSVGVEGYDHVRHCLGAQGAGRQVVVRLPYFYAAPDLIGASDAILTMPTRAASRFAQTHGLGCLPAPVEITGFDYWVLWHDRSARDPATQWLVNMLSNGGGTSATVGRAA